MILLLAFHFAQICVQFCSQKYTVECVKNPDSRPASLVLSADKCGRLIDKLTCRGVLGLVN